LAWDCRQIAIGVLSAVAKAAGVRFGRPRKLNVEQRTLALRLLDEGKQPRKIAKPFRVRVTW
jgi:hypothetical protein